MAGMEVLLVDDEPSIRKMLVMWLEGEGHRVQSAASPKDALGLTGTVAFDMAFVDLRLGQLAPARIFAIEANAHATYLEVCRRNGQRLGNIKPTVLHRDSTCGTTFRGH